MSLLSLARFILADSLGETYPGLIVEAGPELPPSVPGQFVVLTVTGGPGLLTEEALFDGRSFQARCAGEQNNYDSAENLAMAVDSAFRLATGTVDGTRVLSLERSGGPPSVLMVDDADRHHFVASYTATVQSA